MPLKPDDTLLNGQYRIISQLGRGGYGFVYRAEDTLLRKDVAIKELIPALLPSALGDDEEALKRFLAEARATMDLTHELIVRTHTIFPERDSAGDPRYYIVMAYLAGGSLEEFLEQHGRMPVDDAIRLGAQVATALAYAHARGVVHCDLKPANILRDQSGTFRVADFGIAHVSEQMMSRTWQTSEGLVVGTLPYMSPEQTRGQRDDPRLDVYALGAVLYHVLTGTTYVDFGEEDTPITLADNIYRIHNEEPLPPSERIPDIPAWLDQVVLQALRKDPQERMTMSELQEALETRTAAVAQVSEPQRRAERDEQPHPEPPPAAAEAPALSPPRLTPVEARRLEREHRRLTKLEERHRRSIEREQQHRKALEQLQAQTAVELGHHEESEGLPQATPGTTEWADQLRRQIDQAVAEGLEGVGTWQLDFLPEPEAEPPAEESARQGEIRARLETARKRLEEQAKRHASKKLVGPALDQLESLLDQATSKLDAGAKALGGMLDSSTALERRADDTDDPEPEPDADQDETPPGQE